MDTGRWERLFDLTVTRTLALNAVSTCGEYFRDQLAMVLLSNGHVPLQKVQLNREKRRKTLSVIRARNYMIEWRVFTGKGQTNPSLVRFLSADFLTWTYTSIELAHATFYKSRNAHNAHSISILMDLLFSFSSFRFLTPCLAFDIATWSWESLWHWSSRSSMPYGCVFAERSNGMGDFHRSSDRKMWPDKWNSVRRYSVDAIGKEVSILGFVDIMLA